jgi:N-acetylneuraminic acid mutarotase
MRYRLLLPSVLALTTFWLTACGDDTTTEPTPTAEPSASAPELAVASNTWITRANMWSTERFDFATAVVTNASGQSILYAIGGRTATGAPLGKVMAYNVSTNTWTTKASLPRPHYGTNGAGVLNGKIYISGGCFQLSCTYSGYSNRLFMYDPATNVWTEKSRMPDMGAWGVTGVISGKLYVLSGCYEAPESTNWFDDCDTEPANFFVYNRVKDRWSTLPSPTGTHYSAVGGVIQGKFYVTGSEGRLEAYDPATNQWTTKTPQPNPGVARAAGAPLEGKLFVVGGRRGSQSPALSRTIAYDPITNTWKFKAPLPTGRLGIAASRVFLNGQPRMEVVGGSRPGNNLQYIP